MRRNRTGFGATVAIALSFFLAPPALAADPPAGREAMRYDGKPFEYWRDYLKTELKADRRVDAIRALGEFGKKGYATEATEAILDATCELWASRTIVAQITPARTIEIQLSNPVPPENTPADVKVLDEAANAALQIGKPAFDVLTREGKRPGVLAFAYSAIDKHIDFSQKPGVPVVVPLSATALKNLLQLTTTTDNPALLFEGLELLGAAINRDKAVKEAATDIVRSEKLGVALGRALVKGLDQEYPHGISEVASVLGPSDKAVVPTLVRATFQSPVYLREVIGGIETDHRVLARLVAEGLTHENPKTKVQAASWLGDLGPAARGEVSRLLPALKDPDKDVRLATIGALGRIAAPEKVVPALLRVVNDTQEFQEYRIEAALTLAKFGSQAKDALPGLLKVFSEADDSGRWLSQPPGGWSTQADGKPEPWICRAAVRAAVQIGEPKELVPQLIKGVEARLAAPKGDSSSPACYDPATLFAITYLVNQDVGTDKAIPILTSVLSRSVSDKRDGFFENELEQDLLIVRRLGSLGPAARAALPVLRQAEKMKSVHKAARAAIEKIEAKPAP